MKKYLFLILIGLLVPNIYSQIDVDKYLKKPIPEIPGATLAEVGINPDTIQKLMGLIRSKPPFDLRGMVVIKDGKLAIEEYFGTYWRETIHDIRSAGKSITALLMGIAIDKALVKDVNQKVYDFFPEYKDRIQPSEKHLNIRIKDILMMSSGLAADTDDENSPGNGLYMLTNDDWLDFALNLPMGFETGSKWVYNDVCAMLTGAIIEKVSGQKLADFAQAHLFDPLGIREYYWYTGRSGQTGAMGNLYISALDFAKIGLLVLNKGEWEGRQIISRQWIKEIAIEHMDISGTNPFSHAYSFFWYIAERQIGERKLRYHFAAGNGGNYVFVVPSENMVVALISSAYGQGYGHTRSQNCLRYILRALE